nr:ATP-binding cassette domain-containing protein [Methylibium rhizosphaerae]
MKNEHDLQADLRWIAQRCRAVHPSLARVPESWLADPARAAAAQEEGGPIKALFSVMGLSEPAWVAQPAQHLLPMVGHVPGKGWGVILGRNARGEWHFESARGRFRLGPQAMRSSEPTGSPRFTPMLLQSRHDRSRSDSAESMFRAALLQRWPLFVVAAGAALCANLLALAGSLYSMQVYDRVIPSQGLSTLAVLTIGAGFASVLELFIKLVRSRLLEEVVKRMDVSVSQDIFERVTRIRMDQFPRSVGNLAAQLRSYESIRGFLASATMYLAADAPFALLFLLVILAIAGPALAAVPLAFAVLALLVGLFYRRRIAAHAARGASVSNRKFGVLVETVENAELLKAYGGRWRQSTLWRTLNSTSVEEDAQLRHHTEHATYVAGFIQQVSYIAVVGVGAYIASTSGQLSVGALIAASILAGRVLAPVAALPGIVVQWAHARTALDSLEKVFQLEQDNHSVEQPLAPERIRGAYELTNLRFTYPGRSETLAIRQLSIRPGEKVGIVGAIGAGKSTLLKVLAGLYRAEATTATLDGLDIQQIDRDLLSEQVGFCPQQPKLFAGTLRDNLLMGVAAVSEDHLLEVCRSTGVADVIARHPKGLDLPIVEGGEGLSGGQKQLVALTRLILARPNVWLLDEPTASMDEQSEARCLAVLRKSIGQHQTAVLVTHKPTVLSMVDRIVVLTEKGILVDGSRAEVTQALQHLLRAQTEPASIAVAPAAHTGTAVVTRSGAVE